MDNETLKDAYATGGMGTGDINSRLAKGLRAEFSSRSGF